MCKVRDIEECEKRILVYLKDGSCAGSEWFLDDERKNTYMDDRFTAVEKDYYDAILSDNMINEADIDHWAVSRLKDEDDCIYISRHAFDRMKERNGWNRKTSMRMIKKVYDNGLLPEDVEGVYRPWVLRKQAKNPQTSYRMYGEMLYVFDNKVLITVIHGKQLKFA